MTPERLAVLARWLHASRERFGTEEEIRQAAAAEMDATQAELDAVAAAWREGSDVHAVDETTGEILEPDIPFEDAGDEPPGRELVHAGGELVSMFGRYGPREALALAEEYADTFKSVVKAHDLTLEMEDGTDYVLAPAWEAGGQLNGVFTEIESTEPYKDGWKAVAYAHRPATGERWTSRHGLCLRSEIGRKFKPEHEILSMAETRAARNALRAAISVIVTLAGYDAAPLEERPASPKQRARLFAILAQLEQLQPRGKDGWKNYVTSHTVRRFGARISGLNRGQMAAVIDGMERKHAELQAAGDEPAGDDDVDLQPTEEELANAEVAPF